MKCKVCKEGTVYNKLEFYLVNYADSPEEKLMVYRRLYLCEACALSVILFLEKKGLEVQ